jgi:hypothetical protein
MGRNQYQRQKRDYAKYSLKTQPPNIIKNIEKGVYFSGDYIHLEG